MTSRQHPRARTRAIEFRIGDVFAADDPIARWVSVLAMATNHMVYLNVRLIEGGKDLPPETNTYYFRLMAAHFIEAVEWLTKTRSRPPIDSFITGSLPARARRQCDALVAFASQRHPLNAALKRSRVTLFHYPGMHPGRDELGNAMRAIQDHRSSIEGGRDYASFRALFADEIAVQFLSPDEDETRRILEQLGQPVMDLVLLTEQALFAHLKRFPTSATAVRRRGWRTRFRAWS